MDDAWGFVGDTETEEGKEEPAAAAPSATATAGELVDIVGNAVGVGCVVAAMHGRKLAVYLVTALRAPFALEVIRIERYRAAWRRVPRCATVSLNPSVVAVTAFKPGTRINV